VVNTNNIIPMHQASRILKNFMWHQACEDQALVEVAAAFGLLVHVNVGFNLRKILTLKHDPRYNKTLGPIK